MKNKYGIGDRPIKFRAWIFNKKLNEGYMDYDPSFVPHCDEEVNINEALKIDNDTTWLQYTGLKDSKGVEIYEGDVVNDKFHGFGVVVMDDKKGWWGFKTDGSFHHFDGDQKVMGNIFEAEEEILNLLK